MTARAPLTLVLVRHGRAEGNDPRLPDFERRLDARGRAEAASLGRRLRARGLAAPWVLASPALRTLETAQLLLESMDASADGLRTLPQLYLAGTETLADAVRAVDGAARTLMVVAHNPGISEFARWLSPAAAPAGFATGEACVATLSCADWSGLGAGAARALASEPGQAG